MAQPKESWPCDDKLKPFTTDGCSGLQSFVWHLIYGTCPPWQDIPYGCTDHDESYWRGGPRFERKLADQRLRDAVKASGHPIWAKLMYVAVRVGGVDWIPFPSIRAVDKDQSHFHLRGQYWKIAFDGVRWGYGHVFPKYQFESHEIDHY
jgi:hypothetical protein